MTAAFVLLWSLATVLMASGLLIPALIVAGVAVLFGAWHWLRTQARAAFVLRRPIRVD